jgi:ATP-dependent DNA ligase
LDNREYLMLAQVFDSDKHRIGNWFCSLKLDGHRCFWDGGVSRGIIKRDVPYANHEKDERYKEPPIATGLWSRYGNIVHAPDYFLNDLPKNIMLDGELYMGRGKFQETSSIIKKIEPGAGWSSIRYRIFDIPSPNVFFQQGRINNPNFHKTIIENTCVDFFKENGGSPYGRVPEFRETVSLMRKLGKGTIWSPLNQIALPSREDAAREALYTLLEKEVEKGGEGCMLRAPSSMWVPKRSKDLLKVKNFEEGEAVVLGFVNGYGKHRGKMGALAVQWRKEEGDITAGAAVEFQLAGFTDEEREYESLIASNYAWNNEGQLMIGPHNCKKFKRGDVVRFRHRGVTNDGIPREARYWR